MPLYRRSCKPNSNFTRENSSKVYEYMDGVLLSYLTLTIIRQTFKRIELTKKCSKLSEKNAFENQ